MDLRRNLDKLKGIAGLSISLANANFKLRNEGSYFGILWYLLNPLSMFFIIMFVRGTFYNKSASITFYPLYLMLGLIMFNFFSQTIGASTDIISRNRSFVKSMKISKESLILSTILQFIYSHVFEFIVFTIFAVMLGAPLIGVILYPITIIPFLIFILGLSFILATIGVYVNDLKNIWAIISSLLFFATPIFYTIEAGSQHYTANLFNPLSYFLALSRDLVLYSKFPSNEAILIAIIIPILTLVIGYIIFNNLQKNFAEKVQ